MAVQHDYNAVLTLATVDLSDHCMSVEVIETADDLETSAFGAAARTRVGGMTDFVLRVTLQQDQAASEISATLQDLVGTSVAFTAKQDSAATSATNRQWSGNVILTEFPHLTANLGTIGTFSVSWPGTGTLTKATA